MIYLILSATNKSIAAAKHELESQVTQYLEDGWKLYGTVEFGYDENVGYSLFQIVVYNPDSSD